MLRSDPFVAREGAFTVLIGAEKPQGPQSMRTRDYVHAVTRKAQLDFIPLLKPVSAEML